MDPEAETSVLDTSDDDILDRTLSAPFDETEPLMPILESLSSINIDNNNETDPRNEELKLRLTNALKTLEQFDELSDANASSDHLTTDLFRDNGNATAENLDLHVQDDVTNIILSAEDYIIKLEDQLGDLDIADEQVSQ